MNIDRTTMPGEGAAHHLVSRAGGPLCLMVDTRGTRHLLLHHESGLDEPGGDEPARAIALESDEADQVAEIQLRQPIADRLASREWQVDELMRERG